jgi:amino-acid N-acetyltransferase
MDEIQYQWAKPNDEASVTSFLIKYDLPYEDISFHLANFILAKAGGTIIGTNGIEIDGQDGLLRSLAVESEFRSRGISKELYTRLLARAHLKGVQRLFLLTQTAEKYSARLGFRTIRRDSLPASIQNTAEFKSLCPKTAICMMKVISGDIQYYPIESLNLIPDVPGVEMWGIALKKTMFTYFECDPGCRFEKHSHESEQITFVLQGELFFDVGTDIIKVKQGEVIAIPSNIPHAAFTRELSAKACDAWSPVMSQYIRS